MSDHEQDAIRSMAERIARRVAGSRDDAASGEGEGHDVKDELTALRSSLQEVQRRLAHIESHVAPKENHSAHAALPSAQGYGEQPAARQSENAPPRAAHSPWLSGIYVPAAHPSEERFGVEEAAVSELVEFFEKEKTCAVEPGGKPCDHCAMCSSRGF